LTGDDEGAASSKGGNVGSTPSAALDGKKKEESNVDPKAQEGGGSTPVQEQKQVGLVDYDNESD